jgi:hypothetical protein
MYFLLPGGGFWGRFDRIFFWGGFSYVTKTLNEFFSLTPEHGQ